ncbi:hypothetical protein [Archangium lansingense]|uniref:Uncharacterized protein n=1 Tax=Archangium lansingense TaxID=2995310 RepID=A0ABT4A0J9_9BACT|nr:hypothetical protein [Archangium lansinium]MCY1075181.1 hypothetical protein [Archangium lansinium]
MNSYIECNCKRSAYITTRSGKRIYAKSIGKTCFVLHARNCPNRRRCA